MTARHGINGQIWIDTSAAGTFAATGSANLQLIANKSAWTFDANRDFVDVTSFGDTSKTSVAGLPGASGAINGFWDSAGAGSLIIANCQNASTERALRILPDATNAPTSAISGKAFFSISGGGGAAAAVDFTITYQAGPSGITWTQT